MWFFFNHETAYEMRISDCSSYVCSSDLKPQFPDAAGAINGSQRDSLQARRLGTDKVQPATGIGENVGIIYFEIEREQGGAVELPAGRGNSLAVAYLDRLGHRDTDTRIAARYPWQPEGILHPVARFAKGGRCEKL